MQEPSRFLDEIPRPLVTHTRQHGRSDTGAARTPGRGGAPAGRDTSPRVPSAASSHPMNGSRGWEPSLTGAPRTTQSDSADERTQQSETPTEPAAEALAEGDRVIHRLFGRGVVLNIVDDNGVQTAVVMFDQVGKKTLDLGFARLEKI